MVLAVDSEHSQESRQWCAKTLGIELVRIKILDMYLGRAIISVTCRVRNGPGTPTTYNTSVPLNYTITRTYGSHRAG